MNPETDIYLQLLKKFEAKMIETKRISSQAEENIANQLSVLTDSFVTPLSVLRTFGNNPLYFTRVNHAKTGITYWRFDYRRWSYLSVYSFFGQIFYISGFSWLAYRLFNGDYLPSSVPGSGLKAKHSSSSADGLMKTFVSTFFLAASGGASNSFFNTAKFAEYLNMWKEIVLGFTRVFPGKCIECQHIKVLSKRLMLYSSCLSIIYIIWSTCIYKTCIFDLNNNCTWMEREQSFILAGFGCASIYNTTFEQFKLALMLKSTSHALSQIKHLMKNSKDNIGNENYNLRELFKLLYVLRTQTKTLMEIFGLSQLLILFFLFILTIISWMMILQFSAGDISISLVLIIGSIGLVQISRLTLMAIVSEKIVEKEKLILNEISDIKPRTTKEQIEIQIFVGVLTKRPIQFTLSHIITLKRSLFLVLMSNSTTYLIAILQLLDVSNSY